MWSFARNTTGQNKLGILLLRRRIDIDYMLPLFIPKAGRSTASITMSFLLNFPTTVFMGSNKSAASKDTWAYSPIFPNPCPRLCLSHHNLESLIYVMHSLIHSFNKYVLVTNDLRGLAEGTQDTSEAWQTWSWFPWSLCSRGVDTLKN